MNENRTRLESPETFEPLLHLALRFGTLALLLVWCFTIMRPFLTPILWGLIIAIASHPLFIRLRTAVQGRTAVAATLYVLLALGLLVLPAYLLADTLISSLKLLAHHFADGTLRVPPPPDAVRSWILVGEPLHRFWLLASTNLDQAIATVATEFTWVGRSMVSGVSDVLLGFVEFIIAIFVAAALMANAAGGQRIAGDVAIRLAGEGGRGYADLTVRTIRSVTKGIIGVALIQALLAGIGFLAAGIPAAGLLALLCLIIAIVQLPLMLVLLPVVIYAFTLLDPVPATVFAAWCMGISLIDNVLKPLMLGRGVDVPMLVIFIGAIGGLLSSGVLGLFVGPVVLALGYTLVLAWLQAAPHGAPRRAPESP
ncbi:AI-2E family transporter [Xanthobacter autotrophicus]|uniref:AI-2E family transporter n=1 Tax=Xanthobacter TaxID=279 RepID=UPI0024ABCCAE|nr:AI-2E family transporter [Xanthobacter autotrophicus]MDI4665538.1 AI-2E family transporter [Xanthobacter autotrophicus]